MNGIKEETFFVGIQNHKIFCKKWNLPSNKNTEFLIVLLHDALGSTAQWKDIPKLLCEQNQIEVLSYDRINYGNSSFEGIPRNTDYLQNEALHILPQLLNQLAPTRKIILLGHSDGGSIALLNASTNTQIVGCISIAPHLVVENKTIEGIRWSEKQIRKSNIYNALKKYHGQKTDFLISAWVETWEKMKTENWNICAYVKNSKAATLLLQGENDEYGTEQQIDLALENLPITASKIIYPKLKHFPHLEEKTIILKDIRSFIEAKILNNENN